MMRLLLLLLVLMMTTATRAAALDEGIQAMLVGDKMLQVTENRQLTLRSDGQVVQTFISPDGRYVVYTIESEHKSEFRLARTSTGKTLTLMEQVGWRPDSDKKLPESGEKWLADMPVTWSPDSSLFALKAIRCTWDKDKNAEEDYIVIYSSSGAIKKSIPVSGSENMSETYRIVNDKLLFTPDSKRLITNLTVRRSDQVTAPGNIGPLDRDVQLIDVGTGTGRTIYTSKSSFSTIGWSADGRLILSIHEKQELHKVALDGASDEVLVKGIDSDHTISPDGVWTISQSPRLAARNLLTGKQIAFTKDGAPFQVWAPNSRMLLYCKGESVTNSAPKLRKRDFQSLWLTTLVEGDLNHMCVALDVEYFPSCSRDCHSIAYVSRGQLYIAELSQREPTVNEKLEIGLPLNEEETKIVLLNNCKTIGTAILMYAADNDDQLPPGGSIASALRDYVSGPKVFCRPGSQENIFKLIDSGFKTLDAIDSAADTVIGEMDAGFDWVAQLYADGHARINPKK